VKKFKFKSKYYFRQSLIRNVRRPSPSCIETEPRLQWKAGAVHLQSVHQQVVDGVQAVIGGISQRLQIKTAHVQTVPQLENKLSAWTTSHDQHARFSP